MRLLEPPKEGLSGCPREGATQPPFARPWGLANEKDVRDDRRSVDDRANHVRAQLAGIEAQVEPLELLNLKTHRPRLN